MEWLSCVSCSSSEFPFQLTFISCSEVYCHFHLCQQVSSICNGYSDKQQFSYLLDQSRAPRKKLEDIWHLANQQYDTFSRSHHTIWYLLHSLNTVSIKNITMNDIILVIFVANLVTDTVSACQHYSIPHIFAHYLWVWAFHHLRLTALVCILCHRVYFFTKWFLDLVGVDFAHSVFLVEPLALWRKSVLGCLQMLAQLGRAPACPESQKLKPEHVIITKPQTENFSHLTESKKQF